MPSRLLSALSGDGESMAERKTASKDGLKAVGDRRRRFLRPPFAFIKPDAFKNSSIPASLRLSKSFSISPHFILSGPKRQHRVTLSSQKACAGMRLLMRSEAHTRVIKAAP